MLQKRVRNFQDAGLFDADDSVDDEDHWLLRQLAEKTGGKITEAVVDPSKGTQQVCTAIVLAA